jgi:hypothetical protein
MPWKKTRRWIEFLFDGLTFGIQSHFDHIDPCQMQVFERALKAAEAAHLLMWNADNQNANHFWISRFMIGNHWHSLGLQLQTACP